MKESLKIVLDQLDLIENKAVFFRNKDDGEVFDGFSSDTNKKLDVIKPDAFYVFNKQPFVLFFDLTSNIDVEKETEIHKKVWSFDNSPIIFVIKDTDVSVYNALNFEKDKGLEIIKLTEKERNKKFSFWNLQSGEAFEWFYEKHKKTVLKKRVNQQLFENIKQTILILKDNFDFELQIVGDGYLKSELQSMIDDFGLNQKVKLLGLRRDIPFLLNKAHCFLMPSFWEGLPIVLLEAGASRLPIISTSVGSIPVLLNNENSTLVELNSFEEAMIEIINNYEKANKKAQNLFDKIKKEYSIEQIVRKHEKIYLIIKKVNILK